jgi:hypothetical protein
MQPTPPSSKRVVDTVNSAAWFTMDALWIFRLAWPAYVAAGLTVATGVLLLALAWREDRSSLFADLGVNCWIAMNTIWLVSDLNGHETPLGLAGAAAVLGAVFILAAAWHSQDFRRLRFFRR